MKTLHRNRPRPRAMLCALALALAVMATGATLAVASAPLAQTGAATRVTSTTATLNGTVLPGQSATTYYFQYGPGPGYGAQTPTQGPVSGNAGKSVSADVAGLAPSTAYHFRLVASNSAGTSYGADATLTTTAPGVPPAPAGKNTLTLTANHATVTFGGAVAMTGTLSGPGSAGVKVTLEQNPYPYTGGFKATATTTLTSSTGAYALSDRPLSNTHYRVTAKGKQAAISPEVAVRVRLRVGFGVSDRTPSVGQRVRFSGTVMSAHDGKVARIQRRTKTGGWTTVGSTTLVAAAPVNGIARSRYAKRMRVRHSGVYRVKVAPADGDHIAGISVRRRIVVH